MSAKVLVHVGTPKTGTSYLQDVLFRNRRLLAEHGVLYPADRFDAHFLAALDLLRLPWGGLEAEAVGAWDRLAGEVRDWDGTAIISHEILATATRVQAARALASLGKTEVHLVLSVRDLARQIPAEWQENVKHRRTLSYRQFLDQIRQPERTGRIASWFWAAQEVPDILDRWGPSLPPERVHVVTVPVPGAPRGLLWERFSRVFGLDGLPLSHTDQRANPSLGAAETALLRRINRRVNAVLDPADYRPLVRELLAHQTLSRRTGSPRLALPPDLHPWVGEVSEGWIAEIHRRGYDVVGDLEDLRPGPAVASYVDPDRPPRRLLAAAGLDAVVALLEENARLRREAADAAAERDRALTRRSVGLGRRAAERAVRALERERAGRAVLRAYRLARGRSSRSA